MIALTVLIAYLVILAVLGVMGWRRSRNTEEDFYLAGRGQGMIVTVFTIMATMFSSAAILGIPGGVYREGVAFMLFALNLPVAGASIFLFGSRLMRIGRKRGFVTPGDMIADYYGDSALLRVLVALVGALFVLPYIIMQIKAGGLLARTMFPGADAAFTIGTWALSFVTVFYVLVGGMRSVAWTDVLQGALLLFGMMVAGLAAVVALGGFRGFWGEVGELPPEALRLPGVTGDWPWTRLLTVVMYSSVASIIQPGQWMRLYAARNEKTLKRSAMIFATILPCCFLFGSLLVAIAGRAVFPPEVVNGVEAPHAQVGAWDQIVPAMIHSQVPAVLGATMGAVLVSVIFVAVLAASMSTADSNLHSFSAVFMRDIYERFFRRGASEREKAWVGRLAIVVMMLISVALVEVGERNRDFEPLQMIANLMFTAIAFSCQLLPIVLDMLFIRRGTAAGAISGLIAGLVVVFLFTPINTHLGDLQVWADWTRARVDIGFCGFVVNVLVFVAVSSFTRPLDRDHLASLSRDMD